MAGNIKLQTSAGGGVILDTATTTASDVTVKVPVTGVNNGTLVCSDSSGNVGIGVTPSAWNGLSGGVVFENTAGSIFSYSTASIATIQNAYYNGGFKYKTSAQASYYNQSLGQHQWFTAPSGTAGNAISFTQAMTLDASGNLLVGNTTSTSSPANGICTTAPTGGTSLNVGHANGTPPGYSYMQYAYNGTTIGYISQNGTTAVAYNTTSDYRLKENIQPMQNALGVVAQLNPVTYTWKADGSDGQGFIAHELQAVVPDCVTGEKDAVDADGKPVYQGIDTSFLVATLTKAIQEQQAQIETLTAKVAALEAK